MPNESPTVLITGATDGLGLALAHQLSRDGAHVLVHGRHPQKLERVLVNLPTGQGEGPHGYLADLSSLEEVRRLARDVAAKHERIDVLINNAGVATSERKTSRDGFELAFAVNYLAHFLLTLELLPLLRTRERARIVNVASIGQAAIDFDDVMLEGEGAWSEARSYSQSKLAQILFTIELAERLGTDSPITTNALHPATYMATNMVRGMGIKPLNSVATGMEATLRLATSPELERVSGKFFDVEEERRADPQAYDPEARRRLWELSEELTGASGP